MLRPLSPRRFVGRQAYSSTRWFMMHSRATWAARCTRSRLRPRRPPKEIGMTSQQEIQDWIGKQVAGNDVVLFMKGTKQMPQCGFSMQVAQIPNHLGVEFKDINVLDDMSVRDGVKAFSNWPTIPQLYVKGEFIGGCDIVREMFQAGELQELLSAKGVAHNAQTLTA